MGNGCSCFEGVTGGASKSPAPVPIVTARKTLAFLPTNKGKHPDELYSYEKRGVPLGTGAFGTVKKATNKKTGQIVALKSIQKRGRKPADMQVLQNEIDLNSMMDHPNIARMYETFEDSQFIYIAMEICSGGEMFDLIIDEGSFTEVKAAILMEQIFRAVFYMHSHGVAHRDLKPENFLLTKSKVPLDQNTLKVIDFGIASRFDNSNGEGANTLTTKAGTAYYIAPEVLGGRYNEKCDVWSCGVILYILLCGSPPFGGDDDRQIIEAVKRAKLSFSLSEFKSASKDVISLIKECCTLNVRQRISAQQAVAHAWFKQPKNRPQTQEEKATSRALISKLKAFSSTCRFKKAALHIIAHHVDEDNLRKLRSQFNQMDKDGNGELTLAELQAGCEELGLMAQKDIAELFEQIDHDHNGSISYSEFLAATLDQKTYMRRENFWEAFRVFDIDGNGKISMQEFTQIMKDDGSVLAGLTDFNNDAEIVQMFKEADSDGDGGITFEEFVAMMEKS